MACWRRKGLGAVWPGRQGSQGLAKLKRHRRLESPSAHFSAVEELVQAIRYSRSDIGAGSRAGTIRLWELTRVRRRSMGCSPSTRAVLVLSNPRGAHQASTPAAADATARDPLPGPAAARPAAAHAASAGAQVARAAGLRLGLSQPDDAVRTTSRKCACALGSAMPEAQRADAPPSQCRRARGVQAALDALPGSAQPWQRPHKRRRPRSPRRRTGG